MLKNIKMPLISFKWAQIQKQSKSILEVKVLQTLRKKSKDLGAVAIDDDAKIDRPYMGEPLAIENWLRDSKNRREEEGQQNEVLSQFNLGK